MPKFIKSATDLVTSRETTREGFLLQAIRKSTEATAYLEEAQYLKTRLKHVEDPMDLVNRQDIREQLLAATGFSMKAAGHISDNEVSNAIQNILQRIEKDANEEWRDEILHRFLLTRGDSLGGKMRNITGKLAQSIFVEAIMAALGRRNIMFGTRCSKNNPDKVTSISWPNRNLLFDKTPKFIGKNVDVIMVSGSATPSEVDSLASRKELYLACGELKGGIDPAGADEHWKTAGKALDRIREVFLVASPKLFFVGAAIANSMAREIFSELESGGLSYAANFTVADQLNDLASWLVSL